jgi:hypothetical protein
MDEPATCDLQMLGFAINKQPLSEHNLQFLSQFQQFLFRFHQSLANQRFGPRVHFANAPSRRTIN